MNLPGLCPECGADAALRERSDHVYKRDYGPIWQCSKGCDCFVGIHKNDDKRRPLGTLADRGTRRARVAAHDHFDLLWKSKKGNRKENRSLAYKWLALQMGVPAGECHISWMTEEEARRAADICQPFADAIRAKKRSAA